MPVRSGIFEYFKSGFAIALFKQLLLRMRRGSSKPTEQCTRRRLRPRTAPRTSPTAKETMVCRSTAKYRLDLHTTYSLRQFDLVIDAGLYGEVPAELAR